MYLLSLSSQKRLVQMVLIGIVAILSAASINIPLLLFQNINGQLSQINPILFKDIKNSVVGITLPIPITPGEGYIADGSGFVYNKEGNNVQIITNEHVVSGYDTVDVTFEGGDRYTAKVIGTDIQGDLAVLQIVWNSSQSIKPLVIGNSSNLEAGEQVIAIGNPFLEGQSFENVMTTGIISKVGAEVEYGGEFGSLHIQNAIITDAAINPGNSGGPLLNVKGEVIGINTAGDETIPVPMGYAIPSNVIRHIVPTLIEKGEYEHPWIGIEPITLTSVEDYGIEDLPSDLKGILVYWIDRDSPAHKAGIIGSTLNQFNENIGGDIITAIDGHPITTRDEFNAYIDEHKSVSDDVILTLYRNGTLLDLRTSLEANPYYNY
jgi:S1-C subfamily serine protease